MENIDAQKTKNLELVALLSLSSWCLVIVVWLFLVVPWVCLRFVFVVFPHTNLLFFSGSVGKALDWDSKGCL